MSEQPKLSDAEWALLIDLLQQERDQLPVEIHHTRSTAFRGELQRRRQMVETLLERLRAPVAARGRRKGFPSSPGGFPPCLARRLADRGGERLRGRGERLAGCALWK